MKIRSIVLSILILGTVVSCSTKKNPLGNDTGKVPLKTTIEAEELIDYCYTYEDSLKTPSGLNKLITGYYEGNESISLIRFSAFPDSGFVLQEDATLTLGIKSNYQASNISLSLGVIKQNWSPYHASWNQATEIAQWDDDWNSYGNVEILDNVEYSINLDDSVTFKIDKEEMKRLIDDWTAAEPVSYGLAVFRSDLDNNSNEYLEFYDLKNNGGPELSFKYLDAEENGKVLYSRKATYNTFINSVSPSIDNYQKDNIVIADLPPTRTVFKINLPDNRFDVENKDLSKVIINIAELVLYVDHDNSHLSAGELVNSFITYNLLNTYQDVEDLPISDSDIERLYPSYQSDMTVTSDSLVINITSVVQSYIAGIRENNGFIVASVSENRDNTQIHFFNADVADITKRPRLNIVYTKPLD